MSLYACALAPDSSPTSLHSLSSPVSASTSRNSRKSDTVAALAAVFDRVYFLMPLGSPRYHTFVITRFFEQAEAHMEQVVADISGREWASRGRLTL